MKKIFLTMALVTVGAIGGGYFMFSGQSVADDMTTVEKDGKIEITQTVEKVGYVEFCKGQKQHFEGVVILAQERVDHFTAELAKFDKGK